jgi:hypothetical protein
MEQGMEFWLGHVAAAALDGGSVKAYAKRHGVSADALYYWRNKSKVKPILSAVNPSSKFVAVQVAPRPDAIGAAGPAPAPAAACLLLFGAGMRLEMASIPSAEWVARLALATQGAR